MARENYSTNADIGVTRVAMHGLLGFFFFGKISGLEQGTNQHFEGESLDDGVIQAGMSISKNLFQAVVDCLECGGVWTSDLCIFLCDVLHKN
jgi:hypothetical protein